MQEIILYSVKWIGLNLFRDKALVRCICYLFTFYTYLKTESNISSIYQDKSLLAAESDNEIKSVVKGKVVGAAIKEMTLSEVKS